MKLNLWTVAILVLLINLPFGYWRSGVRKFSLQWFLAVHLPVPIVIGLRFASGLGFQLATFPVIVGAFFAGQFLGGWTRRLRAAGTLALLVALTATASSCGRGKPAEQQAGTKDAPVNTIAANADPESLFTAIETRLLNARTLDVVYDITSEGSIPSAVRGMLTLAEGNRAHMSPTGAFMDTPVDHSIVSDGSRMAIRSDTTVVLSAAPPFLNEAIVIGLTRMGHLHNIAVLTGGLPPDHSDVGAVDWVRAANFARSDSVTSPDPTWATVAFDIFMGDRIVAHATLWLDPATGLPAGRAQTVYFPSGDMRVIERYASFTLDGAVPPERFQPVP
jgi:hypothetical protein